jgi:hypothetical protein
MFKGARGGDFSGEHARLGRRRLRLAIVNFAEDCFGEMPKPTPETGVLPGTAMSLLSEQFVLRAGRRFEA